MDLEFVSELNGYRLDQKNFPKERERYQNRMSFLLKGEMGQDIKDVLNGKKRVELTWKERMKYKCKFYINKLFSIF